MSEAESQLRRQITCRGYVKACLTRLYNYFLSTEDLVNSSVELLISKRQRAIDCFQEYEDCNREILFLNPQDPEDVEEVEKKYYFIIEKLNTEINSRNSPPHTVTNANKCSNKLPVIEIKSFSGKYTEYIQFIELFKSIIHNNSNLDDLQKLHYLRSFLKAEAFDLIKNLPLIHNSYSDAMQMLNDRYYNKYLIVNEHISDLLDLNVISKPAPSQIRQFVSSLKQILAALKNLNTKVDNWDPVLICILTRKLDHQTSRSFHMERDVRAEASVSYFIEFLEQRALAMENADTASASVRRQGAVVNAVAVRQAHQGCHYCAATEQPAGTGPPINIPGVAAKSPGMPGVI